jgi:hypothetical protein
VPEDAEELNTLACDLTSAMVALWGPAATLLLFLFWICPHPLFRLPYGTPPDVFLSHPGILSLLPRQEA